MEKSKKLPKEQKVTAERNKLNTKSVLEERTAVTTFVFIDKRTNLKYEFRR